MGREDCRDIMLCAAFGLAFLALLLVAAASGPAVVGSGASARELAVLSSPVGWLLDRAVRMRVAIVAFSLWGVSAWLRCPDRVGRRLLAGIAALLVLWMVVVIVKWKTSRGVLATYLWYAYYVPMALVPVACAALGAHVAGLGRRPACRRLLACALAVSATFVAVVFTNDLHQWFFVFDAPTAGMLGEYSYGWAHAAFLGWSAVCYGAFFACLALAARRRLRLLLALVLGICLVGLAYAVAYVVRFEPILHLNFSLTYALVVVLALELSLDLGLLPSVVSLSRVFEALPLDLSVVSDAGDAFRSTHAARPLSGASRAQVAALDRSRTSHASWGEAGRPDVRVHAWPIAGGWAVLAQDVSGLNEARRALARRGAELARRNAMLEHDRQIAELVADLSSEERLVGEVEGALTSSLDEVSRSLASLPAATDALSAAARRRELERVRTLVAYCKRKGALVLAEQEDPELDRDRIRLIANELAGDLRAVGIDCAAVVDLTRPLPAREMSVIYDCVYDFAFAAFDATDPVLMYHLGERDDGCCELRACLQSADGDDLSSREQARTLRRLLEGRGVLFSLTGETGLLRLVLRVRGGGER